MRAAEAQCRDDSTTRDGHLLTGQGADDLPEFCRRLVAVLRSSAVARV